MKDISMYVVSHKKENKNYKDRQYIYVSDKTKDMPTTSIFTCLSSLSLRYWSVVRPFLGMGENGTRDLRRNNERGYKS